MQLLVILVGKRIATLVLWSRDSLRVNKDENRKRKLFLYPCCLKYSNNRYDISPIKRVTRKFLEVSFRRPRGSHSGREKFSSTGMRAPGYRLSPDHFQKLMRIPAPDWAQKMLCIIVPSWQTISPGIFSWVRTRRLLSRRTCPVRAPKKCTQSENFQFDIKSPSDFKILSARKLKTLFQKYKLELITGIHAWIGQFLKDTTTADSHENVA